MTTLALPWTVRVILAHVDYLFSRHRTSVEVRHYTQEVRVYPSAHRGRPCLSVCVRVCPSAHRGHPRLSVSTHISTVLGLSTLTLHVDCSGDFGPHGLSVQYTQDVRGCPPAHTGRPWLSVNTHRTFVAVRVCPSAHTGRLWLSISTYISALVLGLNTLVLGLSTLALPVDCLGDFGPRGLSVQYTRDVRGCPPAHTRCSWLSVSTHRTSMAVLVCPCVSVSTHRTYVAVYQYTYQKAGPWTQHAALPVDCSCDFGPRGLSVQYTQDVLGFPSAHTGRSWLSVCFCVCPCVSVSTHRTSMAVYQYTYQPAGPWTQHAALPVDCSGDFGPSGLSVQYTQDVCGFPPAHIGRPLLSVAVSQHTQNTSVAVHQYTYQHAGPWTSTLARPVDCLGDYGPCGLSIQYIKDVHWCPPAHTGRPWLSVAVRQHTQDVSGCPCVSVCVCVCPCVSVSTHRTSVAVHQYTYQHVGPWTQHAGPSRRPWVSASTLRTYVAVCGCPSAHTGRPWLSVCVHVCLCVSVSTHKTSVAIHQYTYQHAGPWTQHAGPPVDCSDDFGPRGLSVQTSVCVRQHTEDARGCQCVFVCVRQHTEDVRGCPSVHISARSLDLARWPFPWTVRVILAQVGCLFSTHRTSVGVHQHTQDVRGCLWLSVSTHRTSMAVRVCSCMSVSTHRTYVAVYQYTYLHAGPRTQHAALPVDCSGDFGPRGLSVQYTQDVRGCQSAHTGRPWLSVCVRVCPSAHSGLPWLSISTHISTLVLGLSTLPFLWTVQVILVHVGFLFSTYRTSVGFRQHTKDVCGCLWLSFSTLRTSVAIRVCPSSHTGGPWLSISTHISTLVLGLARWPFPWTVWVILAYVGCLFSTQRMSVGVRQHTQDVRGYLWLSVSTHMTLVAVPHTGRRWLSISTHISTLVLGLSMLALPVDCLGDFGPRGLSVQYTGRPWVSASTLRTSVAVRQHTQDVRGYPCVSMCVCVYPSAHTGRPWLSISTHISTLALPWTVRVILAHVGYLFSRHMTSVEVRHYTQDVRVCPSAHRGRTWLSVCVRVCPSAHRGRPWLSVSTHISTVLGLSTLTLPVTGWKSGWARWMMEAWMGRPKR
ncbi:hypothetical protein IGI04_040001 [Brassica rapa subsp. trilocularis]|uniref:Uncharacterized protein n=1 Tax=Brassica rapa subsp. trilocularis TaxID=1813537 RepID=A0ABQ7KLK6_BRACM|nr:hypothetical protein IGI04_040001 [Brassica rapa subsp. trilocularis]